MHITNNNGDRLSPWNNPLSIFTFPSSSFSVINLDLQNEVGYLKFNKNGKYITHVLMKMMAVKCKEVGQSCRLLINS